MDVQHPFVGFHHYIVQQSYGHNPYRLYIILTAAELPTPIRSRNQIPVNRGRIKQSYLNFKFMNIENKTHVEPKAIVLKLEEIQLRNFNQIKL